MIKTLTNKRKIDIRGVKYKVDKNVYDLIMYANRTIKTHEIAMITWVHLVYNKQNLKDVVTKDAYDHEFYNYVSKIIPDFDKIIERMQKIDEKKEKEQENTKKDDKKSKK